MINKRLGKEFVTSDVKKKGGGANVKERLDPKLISIDEEGRVIVVQITVQGEKIILVGIYAPNGNKDEFFGRLEERLMEFMD